MPTFDEIYKDDEYTTVSAHVPKRLAVALLKYGKKQKKNHCSSLNNYFHERFLFTIPTFRFQFFNDFCIHPKNVTERSHSISGKEKNLAVG